MTATYYSYHMMTEKLLFGVALTNEHMNEATLRIAKYLRDCGAAGIADKLGLYLEERERDGKIVWRRICFRLSGDELTVKELCNIGLFLPYGALYGKCGMGEPNEQEELH